MAEEYCIVYMHHIFCIPSSPHGHLSCFNVLAIVNTTPVNTGGGLAQGTLSALWWPKWEGNPGKEGVCVSWCWERLKAGGEWGNRGWAAWLASPTWWTWTWVWAMSGRWWRTGTSGVLQSMGLQRVGHDWATEQRIADSLCCAAETNSVC